MTSRTMTSLTFASTLLLSLVAMVTHAQPAASNLPFCMPDQPCWPSPSDIQTFAGSLIGHVILPSHPMYANLTIEKVINFSKQPGMVVLVLTGNDVRKCLAFALKHDIRVTMHSSGHDYNGRSTADGSLQINFLNMAAVTVNTNDPRSSTGASATAQPGAEFTDVYAAVSAQNMQIVGGFCPSVSVSGYTMGGGFGPLCRSYGLAADNVIEFEIVLFDGVIARCTSIDTTFIETAPDGTTKSRTKRVTELFWAVRGGGGGTYGVLISITFRTHPTPPGGIVGLTIMYPMAVNGDNTLGIGITKYLINYLPNLPPQWGGLFVVGLSPIPEISEVTITLNLVHNGAWGSPSMAAIDDLMAFSQPVQMVAVYTNYTDYNHYSVANDFYPRYMEYLHNSGFIHLKSLKSQDALASFLNSGAVTTSVPGIVSGCALVVLGGAVKQFALRSAAIGEEFRYADFQIGCFVISVVQPPGTIPNAALHGENEVLDRQLAPFRKGVYLNEAAMALKSWWCQFWGRNYYALDLIKRRYDPLNFFLCHHCVGSCRSRKRSRTYDEL